MDTTAPTSPQLDKKPQSLFALLLINRNHALLRVGMTTSQIGNFIFTTSMLLWITTTLARNAPWAAFAVGALVLIPQIVGLLSGTFAGVFVDRWNTRRTLLTMDGTRALILLLLLPAAGILPLPFPAGSDAASIFQLICALLVIAAISVCNPFVNAGLVALVFDIVGEAELARAFGRGQLLNGLCTIIGPPLAALIFFTLGVQWSIALDIISFAVSFAFLLAIRPPADEKGSTKKSDERKQSSFLRDLTEGLRFVAGNNVLTVVCITETLSILGLGPITILGIFFVTNNLHSSPQFYPILNVSLGIGAMAGAVIAPWLQKKLGLLRSFWLPGLATGTLLLIFARLNIFWLACLALALIGISEIVQNVAQGPLMLKATPRNLIGRANAVLGQLATLATLTSVTIASFLVATPLHDKHFQLLGANVSTLDMIFMASGVIVFASGLCAVVTLRHYGVLQTQTAPSQEANTTEASRAGASPAPTVGDQSPPPPPVKKKLWAITGAGLALAVLLVVPLAFASPAYQGTGQLLLAPGTPASGQAVDGLSCAPVVGTQTHYSIHLSLYANDTALAIPPGIGIVAPRQPGVVALAANGKTTCLYPLHVYESDNLIHVELTKAGATTLGQFFDIWGQPLNRTQILGYQSDAGQSLIFKIFDANGDPQSYTGDPRSILLSEHETIVVLFQSPHVLPRPFTDWNGV